MMKELAMATKPKSLHGTEYCATATGPMILSNTILSDEKETAPASCRTKKSPPDAADSLKRQT
jgi:hypothetical protein